MDVLLADAIFENSLNKDAPLSEVLVDSNTNNRDEHSSKRVESSLYENNAYHISTNSIIDSKIESEDDFFSVEDILQNQKKIV